MWAGYFGDTERTVICGEPSRRQQEIYTTVHESLRAATAAMRAENTNADVAAAVRKVAGGHQLVGNLLSLFMGLVGMGANEPPDIASAGRDRRARGEHDVRGRAADLGRRGAGRGGVRLEDTVVVTKDGGMSLTRTSFDRRLLLGDAEPGLPSRPEQRGRRPPEGIGVDAHTP